MIYFYKHIFLAQLLISGWTLISFVVDCYRLVCTHLSSLKWFLYFVFIPMWDKNPSAMIVVEPTASQFSACDLGINVSLMVRSSQLLNCVFWKHCCHLKIELRFFLQKVLHMNVCMRYGDPRPKEMCYIKYKGNMYSICFKGFVKVVS